MREAKKSSSNSSVANGDRCSEMNDNRPKIRRLEDRRLVTVGLAPNESRLNLSVQVSRSVQDSRSVEESNMV